MLIELRSPSSHSRGPLYMQQVFAALHQANRARVPLTLIFARLGETVGLYCRYPRSLRAAVEAPLLAKYPHVKLARLSDDALEGLPAGHQVFTALLTLKPDLFAIRRFGEFEDMPSKSSADPMGGVLETLAPGSADPTRAKIEMLVVPMLDKSRRKRRARWAVEQLARARFRENSELTEWFATLATGRYRAFRILARILAIFGGADEGSTRTSELTTSSPRSHDREDEIQAASDKIGHHLFDVQIRLTVSAPAHARERALKTLRAMAGAFGPFTSKRRVTFRTTRIETRNKARRRWNSRGFLLSDEELATLWHPTTEHVKAERMITSEFTELEPPPNIPRRDDRETAVLGRTKFRARDTVFGIRKRDRRRHLAVIGKTGMGKSTLLLNLIASDIQAGRGVALIDPHGDLAEALLETVPTNRTNDVVLFDAGDRDHPVAFNPLSCQADAERDLVAAGVLSAFKKLYGDSWGPRLETFSFIHS